VKYAEFADTLALFIVLFFLIVFNLWALIIYFLTKQIKRPSLRDILFYLLLFLFYFSPLLLLALFG
jgi:hypothetical protein